MTGCNQIKRTHTTFLSSLIKGLNFYYSQAGNNLYSWGRNDYGQLGRTCSSQGAIFDHIPKEVPVEVTKQVVCGSEHNIALLGKGQHIHFISKKTGSYGPELIWHIIS